jgi:microcystin-dependent protein
MTQPYIAQIHIFPYNFAPRGYAFCWGQILPIQQNTALFSLIGTFYGGNGQTNFALPDFRGRAGVNQGQGPGLSDYVVGEQIGSESVTLLITEMPAHSHQPNGAVIANSAPTATPSASSTFTNAAPNNLYSQNIPPNQFTQLAPLTIGITGGSQPHANQQPYLALYYCIALQGVFPARN